MFIITNVLYRTTAKILLDYNMEHRDLHRLCMTNPSIQVSLIILRAWNIFMNTPLTSEEQHQIYERLVSKICLPVTHGMYNADREHDKKITLNKIVASNDRKMLENIQNMSPDECFSIVRKVSREIVMDNLWCGDETPFKDFSPGNIGNQTKPIARDVLQKNPYDFGYIGEQNEDLFN